MGRYQQSRGTINIETHKTNPVNYNSLGLLLVSSFAGGCQLQSILARFRAFGLHFVSFPPVLFPFQADDCEGYGADNNGLEDQRVVHVKRRMCIRSGSQRRFGCWDLLIMMVVTYIVRMGHVPRIITIVKV